PEILNEAFSPILSPLNCSAVSFAPLRSSTISSSGLVVVVVVVVDDVVVLSSSLTQRSIPDAQGSSSLPSPQSLTPSLNQWGSTQLGELGQRSADGEEEHMR
ncbi:hypothetical protein PMAYCL1PPCAC_11562, partial [Pristionchus mayeri]